MIAADDPDIRLSGAGNLGDYVVDRLDVPIRNYLQMYFGRPNADVIRQGKAATPLARSHRSAKRLQQRLRVTVRDWKHRNLRDGLRIFAAQTFCVRRCAHSGRERIAGIAHEVHHAAALYTVWGAHRAVWENRIFEIPVIVRIGVDQATDGSVLIRDLRLYATP